MDPPPVSAPTPSAHPGLRPRLYQGPTPRPQTNVASAADTGLSRLRPQLGLQLRIGFHQHPHILLQLPKLTFRGGLRQSPTSLNGLFQLPTQLLQDLIRVGIATRGQILNRM